MILVLGDFSAVVNPAADRARTTAATTQPEGYVHARLSSLGLSDTWRAANDHGSTSAGYTLSRQNDAQQSRIDYIYADNDLVSRVLGSYTLDPNPTVTTDHLALVTTFEMGDIMVADLRRQVKEALRRATRRVLDTRSVTDEHWDSFKMATSRWVDDQAHTHLRGDLGQQDATLLTGVDQLAEAIDDALRTAGQNELVWRTVRHPLIRHGQSSRPATAARQLGEICRKLRLRRLSAPEAIERAKLVTPADVWTDPGADLTVDPLPHLNTLHSQLVVMNRIERARSLVPDIKAAIDARCSKYTTDLATMIKSLLSSWRTYSGIGSVRSNGTMVTQPTQVQEVMSEQMAVWFAQSRELVDDELNDRWRQRYRRENYVPPNAFADLTAPPSFEEFLQAVRRPDPRAHIYCIPKGGEDYTGDVSRLGPIKLLDTLLKVTMSILTSRLTKNCTRYDLLRGFNSSVLPGTSTDLPISAIMAVLEQARENKAPAFIYYEDKSRA
ncbi:hypothetical protein RI367_007816 [Sorochytrium milnesiophthora]